MDPFATSVWLLFQDNLKRLKTYRTQKNVPDPANYFIFGVFELNSVDGKLKEVTGAPRLISIDTLAKIKVDESEKKQVVEYVRSTSSSSNIACVIIEKDQKTGLVNIHLFSF